MALLPGSKWGIGMGAPVLAGTTDQRGFPADSPPDVGAFQTPNGWKNGSQLVVTSTADGSGVAPGTLDLRGAIDLASVLTAFPTETITFSPTVFATAQTITLTQGQLLLNVPQGQSAQTITITPPMAGVTVNGAGSSRVIQIDPGVTANISGMTITGGTSDRGAGVLVLGGATVNLSNSTLSGNTAQQLRVRPKTLLSIARPPETDDRAGQIDEGQIVAGINFKANLETTE